MSAAAEARKKAERGDTSRRKLPLLWKCIMYGSLGLLCGGDLVYYIELFNIQTDSCIPNPSSFDEGMANAKALGAVLLTVSVVGGIWHLENK